MYIFPIHIYPKHKWQTASLSVSPFIIETKGLFPPKLDILHFSQQSYRQKSVIEEAVISISPLTIDAVVLNPTLSEDMLYF